MKEKSKPTKHTKTNFFYDQFQTFDRVLAHKFQSCEQAKCAGPSSSSSSTEKNNRIKNRTRKTAQDENGIILKLWHAQIIHVWRRHKIKRKRFWTRSFDAVRRKISIFRSPSRPEGGTRILWILFSVRKHKEIVQSSSSKKRKKTEVSLRITRGEGIRWDDGKGLEKELSSFTS